MNGNMSEKRKAIVAALVLTVIGTASAFLALARAPSTVPPNPFLSPGGVSASLEYSLGTAAPVIFMISAVLCLLFAFGRKCFSSLIPLAAVIFLMPVGGEALALPLVAVMALAPAWAAVAAAIILPFFSKLALVCFILAITLRLMINGRTASAFLPAAGLISPPLLASFFNGDILLPFLLSACSFPPYAPVRLFSPLFVLFILSALWLLIDRELGPGKVLLAFASFFFGPIAAVPAILPVSADEKKHAGLKFLFIVPLLWGLASPQEQAALPDGFKEILTSLKGSEARIACPPEFHDETAFLLQRTGGRNIFPAANVRDLRKYYTMLPVMPPFLGHATPETDILFTRAYYPDKSSLRPFRGGWKIVNCGEKYAVFASDAFLASSPGLKHLEFYTPYSVLPPDEELKKGALREVEDILKGDSLFFEGLRDAGKLLLDLNEPQKAEKYFNEALKIRKSAEIYNDLGVSLANSGKPDASMTAYLEAMKLSPRDIYPRMNYASAAFSVGKNDEGKMVLEDVVRAYPTFYPAVRMLSQAYGREGNVGKAVELLSLIPREQRTKDENDLVGDKR